MTAIFKVYATSKNWSAPTQGLNNNVAALSRCCSGRHFKNLVLKLYGAGDHLPNLVFRRYPFGVCTAVPSVFFFSKFVVSSAEVFRLPRCLVLIAALPRLFGKLVATSVLKARLRALIAHNDHRPWIVTLVSWVSSSTARDRRCARTVRQVAAPSLEPYLELNHWWWLRSILCSHSHIARISVRAFKGLWPVFVDLDVVDVSMQMAPFIVTSR